MLPVAHVALRWKGTGLRDQRLLHRRELTESLDGQHVAFTWVGLRVVIHHQLQLLNGNAVYLVRYSPTGGVGDPYKQSCTI